MSEKLYTVVGKSTNNGKTAIRFANDINRSKVLARNGHTDIHLIVLPHAMTKENAEKYWTAGNAKHTDSYRDANGRFTKQAFVVTSVELAA